ncbi:MAG: SUF system NifU family Fe-S cluster assembly protein [Verrucomicrobiae bacterium]|nr:SUF system NifU family Fe-S cluster assembly protein [Verrucomicrobiae bacterium]
MDDLSDLYQDIILSHNKRPRNQGELENATGSAEGYNPLCGDHIHVYVHQDDSGKVDDISFTGKACAICTASTSIMTEAVKGKSREEIDTKAAEALEMLTSKEEPTFDLLEQGDFAALAGVRQFPARIKCATLGWHTLESALKGGEMVNTEKEEG